MNAGKPQEPDESLRAELGALRIEFKELELRLLARQSRLAWTWVVAIYVASLALGVAILGVLITRT